MRTVKRIGTEICVCPNPSELALEAARHFSKLADQYAVGAGRFTVALSGGSTPRAMFSLLAAEPLVTTIPWSSVHFFWGDERAVPPTHPGSNYRMANDTLLSKAPIPRDNIHRIRAELDNCEEAAREYSDRLRQFFAGSSGSLGTAPLANWPRFDLVLLGMGADGHTASLFPYSSELRASVEIAVATYVQKLNAKRITLTAATINNARNVAFLVSGEDKASALKSVIDGPANSDLYPSQMIRPRNGALLWLVDEDAAKYLG